MAKALYGHIGGTDARLVIEIKRLRARVAELESQVERLELERALSLPDADLLTVDRLPEPGLMPLT